MPAGLPYFAWIDPGEEEFGPEHLRWDEQVFSFELTQGEGDPASLTVVVRRPRNVAGDPIGLLGPGRKIWCWFAFDCGPDLVRFRGRLVGVPTSLFEDLVTLEFVARPIDLVAQKEALAESLRVLPYYDEVVIDEARRTDPEVVLEGYSAIWHYDRETHELTVSDEIDGEDGLVEFDGASEDGKVLYDGLAMTLTSGPLARVDVAAEYTWTQQVAGSMPLTSKGGLGAVSSFTFTADDWPKTGDNIGDGWQVGESTVAISDDVQVLNKKTGGKQVRNWPESYGGGSTTVTVEDDQAYLNVVPPGSIFYQPIVTEDKFTLTYTERDSPIGNFSVPVMSSYDRTFSEVGTVLVPNHTQGTLHANYKGNRQCTEKVSFSLYADVQHILSDPEDGEALRIDDVKSVNLSEPIGEGTGAYVPMGDTRRRSYIATARGNQSLEYLIALARAHLLKRARVVEITFAPKLARMPEITLRKNAFLADPRIGEAVGKIIGYSLALDGADGQIKCEVRIGCAIGRGGSAVATDGEPTYCSVDYAGPDYQQFIGRVVLLDTSVGYEPPNADPNDDGIEFTSALTAANMFEIPPAIVNPAGTQAAYLSSAGGPSGAVYALGSSPESRQQGVKSRHDAIANALDQVQTRVTFTLKSVNGDFTTDYAIGLTDLKIPTGYDLEAS